MWRDVYADSIFSDNDSVSYFKSIPFMAVATLAAAAVTERANLLPAFSPESPTEGQSACDLPIML